MKYINTYILTIASIPVLFACGNLTSSSDIKKIIDTNDLTPVLQNGDNLPEKYKTLIDAFGITSNLCTATHVGNGIVLSAGHCFTAPEIRTNNASCAGVTIRWGFRQDKAPYLTSNCEQLLAYETNEDLDYAIFKVDKAPAAAVAIDITQRHVVNTSLTIFGFPNKRPLEWSKTCILQDISKGNFGISALYMFSHQCDTEGGSSGSAVLDDTSLKIIGIHNGGVKIWNYGTFLIDTPLAEYINTIY